MERTLARSILTTLTAASTSTVRHVPSISSSSCRYHAHRHGRQLSRQLAQASLSSSAAGSNRSISLGYRTFSSASISRYADNLKGSRPSVGAQTENEDNVDQPKPMEETVTSTSAHTLGESEPPETSSSHTASTHTAASDPSNTNSNNIQSHASALLERLRSTTASLPSFDGLTSSTSLSNTVASITTQSRTLLSHLRTKLSHLSTQYNTHTGYSAIEDLKSRISELEKSLDSARTLATTAKKTYLLAVQNRSASQRETNDLLSRKNSWDETDLSRYTELLRKEHALSKQETEAEKVLEKSEAEVQASFDELMKAVMVRYHEEQIWSDRMRGMSTYGSLIVAGLNGTFFPHSSKTTAEEEGKLTLI